MGKHIVFIGAGAVGGYVGAHLARAGEDVALVDAWPEHIEAIKRDGMHLGGSQGEHVVKVKAMHMSDVQSFVRKPVDIAIICTKSYDTEWAAMMIKQYLTPQGYIVSMQNGINEERERHQRRAHRERRRLGQDGRLRALHDQRQLLQARPHQPLPAAGRRPSHRVPRR
jgi:ketopantoate reductase